MRVQSQAWLILIVGVAILAISHFIMVLWTR